MKINKPLIKMFLFTFGTPILLLLGIWKLVEITLYIFTG